MRVNAAVYPYSRTGESDTATLIVCFPRNDCDGQFGEKSMRTSNKPFPNSCLPLFKASVNAMFFLVFIHRASFNGVS